LLEAGDVEGAARVLYAPAEVVTAELRAARVRVAFERRDVGAARRLVAAWPSHGESRSQRSRGLWEVVLHDAAGDRAAALERLAAVVADAERERDVGVFRAAHDHVLPAARALYFAAPSPFLRAVVERPPRTAVSGISLGTAVPSALTRREQAILAALPVLASNQDIADRLAISPNTLKTHLKHIYRKLDVTCRSDAVVEAERLRLL
jgi:LuxR family maltose regulon positive regulatory protein